MLMHTSSGCPHMLGCLIMIKQTYILVLPHDLTVQSGVEHTYVKSRLISLVSECVTSQLALCCQDGSASSIHYAQVWSLCTHTYGRHSASYGLVVMCLRLGYRCYWEVSGAAPAPCSLCAKPGGHTLHHYVPLIAVSAHRATGTCLSWFINNNVLLCIVKRASCICP